MKQQILQAIKNTKNSTQKKSSLIFLADILKNLNNQLLDNNYQAKRFSCFVVSDPKIREIFAPAYTDRIIHHLLVDNINKNIDKNFIFDSFVNRKEKGIHKACKRLQKFLRKDKTSFYLQTDIKTFFPSIDKNILEKIVIYKIKNLKELSNYQKKLFINLSKTIIWQNPINPLPIFTGNKNLLNKIPKDKSLFYVPKDKGLPIGSLTSQFFSNLYLNELDQFVKHNLKVKYYLRYVDDFILLAPNPQILNDYLKQIKIFLKKELNLEINQSKTIIQPSFKGINFLGYIVRKNYLLIRKRSIKSFKRSLYFFNHLIDPKKFPNANPPHNSKLVKSFKSKEIIPPIKIDHIILNKILATINSYYGIFSFGNTYKLRKSLYQKHFHHLKKYFQAKNKDWKSMKINKEKDLF